MSDRKRRVLVIDDEPEARWLSAEALIEHGFTVTETGDGIAAKSSIEHQPPDLIVLDLGLPGIDGLDLLKWLRHSGDVPVIVVTGRAEPSDRIVGLELGADDYVVKPFDPRELVARVNAVLRRGQSNAPRSKLDYGELVIDLTTRDVSSNGILVTLTAKEFDLLSFLAGSPRQVFSREQILASVWGSSSQWQDPSTVNEHIHRLRRKVEPGKTPRRWIETMRGAGYRFTP